MTNQTRSKPSLNFTVVAVLTVMPDCAMTLRQMLFANACTMIDKDITPARFPIRSKGKKRINVSIGYFDRSLEIDEMINGGKVDGGYVHAPIEVLPDLTSRRLSLPMQYRRRHIVSLGSVSQVRGGTAAPCIYEIEEAKMLKHGISLLGFGSKLPSDCLFAVIPTRPRIFRWISRIIRFFSRS